MKTAIYAPIFNDYGDPRHLVQLAIAAERAGWDGVFIWDHLAIEPAGRLTVVDATVALAAMAQATSRIRLGAMITPLARRRPWKLAKELNTLDHLSGGRAVLGVGLGEPAEVEFANFGEDPGSQARARRLDEGLAILDPLLRGETVTHVGEYYRLTGVCLAPRSLQRPRVPIWVAASLPARAGLRRGARWDGIFPLKVPAEIAADTVASADWSQWWLTPAELAAALAYVAGLRTVDASYAVVASGRVLGEARDRARAQLGAYAKAGANWWFEWADEAPGTFDSTLAALEGGPPIALT